MKALLVVCVPGFGDVLLTTPLLAALKRAYPAAALDVLVLKGREGVLENNPDVREVLGIAKRPRLKEQAALVRRIRGRYDIGISTSRSERPTWYVSLAATWRAALLPRGGRRKDWWKRRLLHAWVDVDEETHVVLQTRRFAALLGIDEACDVVPPRANGRAAPLDAPYAVIHTAPTALFKRWTDAGWAAVARALRDRGLRLAVTGSKEDRAEALPPVLRDDALDLRGELRFGELTPLLEGCTVFLGPDTSVTHLAAAVGAPTVAVYGPTNLVKWGPWPKGHRGGAPYRMTGSQRVGNVYVVQGAGACVPCIARGCEDHMKSRSACLDELPASRVLAAVETLLG